MARDDTRMSVLLALILGYTFGVYRKEIWAYIVSKTKEKKQ